MKVIISGCGIIGSSIGYYLDQAKNVPGQNITMVDACMPASSASGKAGGFLALDWCDGTDVEELARMSYALHEELAKTFQADYRKMNAYSGVYTRRAEIVRRGKIGWYDTTAQVHPKKLTLALVHSVEQRGGTVMTGKKAVSLNLDGTNVTGLRVRDVETGELEDIDGDVVVFAMGAWSQHLQSILPEGVCVPRVFGQKVHSVVVKNTQNMGADALFLADDMNQAEPEVYPRPDGSVYVCGNKHSGRYGSVPPDVASDVKPEEDGSVEYLLKIASVTDKDDVISSQACYLPYSETNRPILSQIPGIHGAYVAAGHSCWGILMGPATGLAMAELIVDGKSTSIDLSPFTL